MTHHLLGIKNVPCVDDGNCEIGVKHYIAYIYQLRGSNDTT